MSAVEISRKDINGQIISKDNFKNYHINFNNNIDIIEIKSFKMYNKIRDGEYYDEDEFFDDEDNTEENKENFIDSYEKSDCFDSSSKDPIAFSRGGCIIF